VVVIVVAGGSNGGGTATVSAGTATANVANFCRDYITVANDYQATQTIDGQDLVLLAKAQAEAPAAVKQDVTEMLKQSAAAANDTSATGHYYDVSTPSARISAWGDSNCRANSGDTGSSSS
jgi:hypothetical protein